MDPLTARAQIAALIDLSPERRRALVIAAMTTTDPDELRRLAYRAKAEAVRTREDSREAFSAAVSARQALAAQRPTEAPQRPQKGLTRVLEAHEPLPAARPVTITWTEPQKPDAVRPEHRPEFAPPTSTKPTPPKPTPAPRQIPEHGTTGLYARGCRCEPCREAKRLSRKPQGMRAPNGTKPEHGTTTAYARGCRCQPCRDAVATAARESRRRSLDQPASDVEIDGEEES